VLQIARLQRGQIAQNRRHTWPHPFFYRFFCFFGCLGGLAGLAEASAPVAGAEAAAREAATALVVDTEANIATTKGKDARIPTILNLFMMTLGC
jgi:hypothetical protein